MKDLEIKTMTEIQGRKDKGIKKISGRIWKFKERTRELRKFQEGYENLRKDKEFKGILREDKKIKKN